MPTRSRYDEVKEFKGKRYTGMKVGRSHKWRYDAGEWKERKVTPDRWEFNYAVVKRRSGRAPEGSGAPVGTAYHWYIVADQTVTKLDANSYMTEMVGHKLKLGHRRADRSTWNASDRAQRKQLVKLLRELIVELETAPVEETTDAGTPRGKSSQRTNGATPARKRSQRTNGAAASSRKRPQRTARPHGPRASRSARGTARASGHSTTKRERIGIRD
jgi:hypothetical protein